MQKTLDDEQTAHNELVEALKTQFKESSDKIQALADETLPALKLMRTALVNMTAGTDVEDAPAADSEKPKEEL